MIIALQTLVYFRQSFFAIFERLLSPYYRRLSLVLIGRENEEVEEEEDQVFAEFDEEKGVVFFPPVYAQRYAAVSDCLMDERWAGKLEKVVDLGYHDMSFIKYLKDMPGVSCILGVDIESIPLRCSSDLLGTEDYTLKRETPLQVTLFQGNAADPDYRLIGCDAVVGIEMIEHMLPHDLDRLVHNVFGFIKPWIAIFTTPNADFNVLFKNMENNGLRRWDHFFEWTREQFNDWCSNIVSRYPQYNVVSKGIGPGPAGTQHLGCCSQMALFVNNDYVKQSDLSIDSLALVAKVPSPCDVQEMIGGWESPMPIKDTPSNNMDNAPSLNRIPCDPSCMTIVLTPSYSIEELEYRDSTSQCNLDREMSRNYLMFNDEDTCTVLVPRRNTKQRVYLIEDVCSRLNCSTFQVKKFSKTTQNLMARNKLDSLVHTREVVDEIRHLTKMLNFNKLGITENAHNGHVWSNINWGYNAPYWNQYYKVVREYNYPFETKSDECRILDLISEEMNRLIDNQCTEEVTGDMNKLEIPLAHLMRVVRHITADVDKVKDLLEWNGYEVVDSVVVHCRLIIDTPSTASDVDWPETDHSSEWDSNEMRSTSLSDGSTTIPDYQGLCLRKALDRKIRKLRSMMCADEDITTELDRVVCRLMKLALWTSKGQQKPPPSRWMQCKLLDLLTLTEKAIARRKKFYMEECFPMKALTFDNIHNLEKYRSEGFAKHIEARYKELCISPELSRLVLGENEIQDELYESSSHELLTGDQLKLKNYLKRTHAWLDKDPETNCTNLDNTSKISSTDQSSCDYDEKIKTKRARKSNPTKFDNINRNDKKTRHEAGLAKIINERRINMTLQRIKKAKVKKCKSDSQKKICVKKSSSRSMNKHRKQCKADSEVNEKRNVKRKIKEHQQLRSTSPQPIPASLIELCHPDLCMQKNIQQVDYNANKIDESKNNIAATEESYFIDIIMDGIEETIALRRTIATEAVVSENQMVMERETLLESALNTTENDLPNCTATESQSIFLFDINEPSTSKGVRHTNMDVQCGPDSTPAYVMLSPATSAARLPSLCDINAKTGKAYPIHPIVRKCFGTSTNIENCGPVSLRKKSPHFFDKGIRITDSDTYVPKTTDQDFINCESTGAIEEYEHGTVFIVPKFRKTGIVIKETFSNESLTLKNIPEENCQFYTKSDVKKESENITNGKLILNSYCEENFDTNCSVKTHGVDQSTENEGSEDDSSGLMTRRRGSPNPELKCEVCTNHEINPTPYRTKTNYNTDFENNVSTLSQSSNKVSSPSKTQTLHSNIIQSDSCSELSAGFSLPKSPIRSSLTTVINEELSIKDKEMPNKNMPPRLTCGGVHMHSYRDKQELEDVMYQGHWQRTSLKTYSRRKTSSFASKCSIDMSLQNKKVKNTTVQNIQTKKVEPEIKPKPMIRYPRKKVSLNTNQKVEKSEVKNKAPIKYPRFRKTKPEPTAVQTEAPTKDSSSVPKNCNATFKLNKITNRAAHRTGVSSAAFKYSKPMSISNTGKILTSKVKPSSLLVAKTSTPTVAKKSTEKIIVSKITKKNYIPAYLRRQIRIKKENHLNNSFGSGHTEVIATSKCNLGQETKHCNNDGPEKEIIPVTELEAKTVKVIEDIKSMENHKVENVKNLNVRPFSTPKHIKVKHFVKNKQRNPLSTLEGKAINKDLLKFNNTLQEVSYSVFRNELEKNMKSSTNCNSDSPRGSTKKKVNNKKQSSVPASPNSTGSSPDSVATVKLATARASRRYSTSSNKSSVVTSESEPTTPARTRKYTKRIKNKKPDDKNCKNKENNPESSKLNDKDGVKNDKNIFMGRNKSVFMALATDTTSGKNKLQTTTKSNVRIPVVSSVDKKEKPIKLRVLSSNSVKKSEISVDSFVSHVHDQTSSSSEISDLVLMIDSRHQELLQSSPESIMPSVESITRIDNSPTANEILNSSVTSTIRSLIEDRLNFLNSNSESKLINEVAKTPASNGASLNNSLSDNLGWSYTSVVQELGINAHDETPTPTEVDALSFKSMTSTSRFSEYFLADNEFENTLPSEISVCEDVTLPLEVSMSANVTLPSGLTQEPEAKAPRSDSVRDIFERKEPLIAPNPANGLAVQAFSGFSMNEDPVSGDQPDYINLIDSETGSLAANYHARQTESEELFVSGRSSESYESCVIEEDAVVPNWLFEMIQQQQQLADADSIASDHPDFRVPLQIPTVQPDMNGNMVEPGVGVAAGAGDGRGIHSDHSQDSSGRGTSLSSSDTSSVQTSEAVLIESDFQGPYELLHDTAGSPNRISTLMAPGEMQVVAFRNLDSVGNESEILGTSRDSRRPRHHMATVSDADADVSSLETDVPDVDSS